MCDKDTCNDASCCGECEPWNCLEQQVNGILAIKEGQLQGYVDESKDAAAESKASAEASAQSAAESKEFRDEAEIAASTAVAAEGIVLGVVNDLQNTANILNNAVAGIAVTSWFYTTVSENQTVIPIPSDKSAADVQSIYIEGARQSPFRGFEFDKTTMTITLAEPLPLGLEIEIILGTYNSDNPNDFANTLASSNGADLVGMSQPIDGAVTRTVRSKLSELLSVKDFGAKGDGVTDDAPAFRAAIGSKRKVVVPAGVYLFNSTLGSVPGVANAPCVVIDGVQDFTFQGEGNPIILMGDSMAATTGNSFILAYTSEAAAAAGKHTKNININGLTFKFKRLGVTGNIAGCNFTSVDGGGMHDVEFDGRGFAPTLGIPGTGSRNLKFNKVRFKGISTCFDNSQLINCRMQNCILDAAGYPVVTGFGHFYDTNTLANIRLDPPPPNSLGYGNLYKDNEIIGYGSPFSIRGMRYSLILANTIHDSIFNDDTTRNMISLFTESKEVLAGFNSGCISVVKNIIYNCRNEKNTTAAFRGVFINRIGGPFDNPHVSNNTIVGLFGGSGPHIGVSMTGQTDGDVITANNVSAATPYGRSVVQLLPGSTDGASPSVVASSGDVILKSLEAGRFVRFGTRVASTDSPISGYILIRDESGVERKLAIIS